MVDSVAGPIGKCLTGHHKSKTTNVSAAAVRRLLPALCPSSTWIKTINSPTRSSATSSSTAANVCDCQSPASYILQESRHSNDHHGNEHCMVLQRFAGISSLALLQIAQSHSSSSETSNYCTLNCSLL